MPHDLAVQRGGADPDLMIWLLDVPYEERTDAKWAGAKWDSTLREWVWRGDTLPDKLQRWRPQRHSWEHWLQDDENGWWWTTDPNETIELRAHQQEAAERIAQAYVAGRPGFLLADQVGLGKTFSAIAGVEQMGEGLHVLVLSPLSVVPHWRRSIDAYGTNNRWCVINYDRAKRLLDVPKSAANAKRTRTKNKRIAKHGKSLVPWDVILADESHLLRNITSQRSAAVRQLIKGHGPEAFVVWMSATAGQNPLELAYVAPLLANATGEKVSDLNDFEAWCQKNGFSMKRGPYSSWIWEPNDSDLERVHTLLFGGSSPNGLRRRPSDLAGWPEQQRVGWPVTLDGRQRQLYEQAWNEFREQMDLDGGGRTSTNALVAALRFRQKASLLRAEETAGLVADLVANDRAVAVSVQFHETLDAIAEKLARMRIECVTITGKDSMDEREANRVRFQTGEVPVVLFTVAEGISLHAGEQAVAATANERAMVIHDLRWSAIETAQIEGRTHRDGQASLAYYLFAEDTAEEKVAGALLDKLESMAQLHGDDTTGLDALFEVVERP